MRGRNILVWCRCELQVAEGVPSPPLFLYPTLFPHYHLGLSTTLHPAIVPRPHQESSHCELPPHLPFLLRVLDAPAFKIFQFGANERCLRLLNCREASLPSLLTPRPCLKSRVKLLRVVWFNTEAMGGRVQVERRPQNVEHGTLTTSRLIYDTSHYIISYY